MPEKPEVITVAKTLEKKIIGKKITEAKVYYDNVIVGDKEEFISKIKDEKIESITTRGKWIIIYLTNYALLTHLRMEGRFYFRKKGDSLSKHEHVSLLLDDNIEMRFHDVRKFGRMILLPKYEVLNIKPLSDLGYEFNDPRLTEEYLLAKFKNKSTPIKTVLLDQSIIAGIGNIYDDEILYQSHINPLKPAKEINSSEAIEIIKNTKIILEKAIKKGGTTIKSFESSEGVHGLFQNELAVHGKKNGICCIWGNKIEFIRVGGGGPYYCAKGQRIIE